MKQFSYLKNYITKFAPSTTQIVQSAQREQDKKAGKKLSDRRAGKKSVEISKITGKYDTVADYISSSGKILKKKPLIKYSSKEDSDADTLPILPIDTASDGENYVQPSKPKKPRKKQKK